MKNLTLTFLILCSLLLTVDLYAQESRSNKFIFSVYAEAFGNGGYGSLNSDISIFGKGYSHCSFRVGFGGGGFYEAVTIPILNNYHY